MVILWSVSISEYIASRKMVILWLCRNKHQGVKVYWGVDKKGHLHALATPSAEKEVLILHAQKDG
jgi:hypothetical protein